MPMVKRRVVNPSPAFLVSVNPHKRKRGSKMATRKRKSHGRKRVVHRAASNPVAKRRHVKRHRSASLRTRSRNPLFTKRRRTTRGRRRNPISRGTFATAGSFAAAAIGVGFFKPVLAKFIGNLLPFGSLNGPFLTAGTGWLTGKIFSLIPVNFIKRLEEPALIVGLSAAIIEAVNPYIRSYLGAAQSPLLSAPSPVGRRMRGIAAVPTTIPPGLAAPVPAPATNGMSGIAAFPAVGSFRR